MEQKPPKEYQILCSVDVIEQRHLDCAAMALWRIWYVRNRGVRVVVAGQSPLDHQVRSMCHKMGLPTAMERTQSTIMTVDVGLNECIGFREIDLVA